MEAIHYAAVEAGRVTPLCGGRVHSRFCWTTKPQVVSCARCRSLLSESDALRAWDDAERAPPDASPRA